MQGVQERRQAEGLDQGLLLPGGITQGEDHEAPEDLDAQSGFASECRPAQMSAVTQGMYSVGS